MTVYEENLKTLDRFYPQMDTLIEEAKEELEEEIEVVEETVGEGQKILKVKKEGKSCYLWGKRNNTEPAKMWVDSLGELQMNAPVLMIGVGNWTYLQQLAEETEKRLTIIVYEPSLQIFLKFLESVNIQKWMERHLIIFWVDGLKDMGREYLKKMLSSVLTYEMLPWFHYLILPNYETLFEEEAIDFIKLCRDIATRESSNYLTVELFSSVSFKNIYANTFYLCDGYKTTQLPEVIPRDIPGIIVAAGPSLNKNIKELKKAKGKAFIMAVDTALKPLLKEGIVPDMFAIIDGIKPLDLVKVDGMQDIPLFASITAASEVLDYHTGKKFFADEGIGIAEKIFMKSGKAFGDVPTGGSVATSAFGLLRKIGINTIILVGQDLAYTNNKSHADGTFFEVMGEHDTSEFEMVEGNYEEKVPTATDLKLFLTWYNDYIEKCQKKDKGFRVINATEGGAKIKGTEIMTLREAIEQECTKEIDIKAALEKLPPMLEGETRQWALDYLYQVPQTCRKIYLEAQKVKKSYQKLDKICDKKNIDAKEYKSILKKLEKQIKNLEKENIYQIIETTFSKALYILRSEQFLQEDSLQAEGKEIARKGLLYMKTVADGAKVFEEYTESVIEEKKSMKKA